MLTNPEFKTGQTAYTETTAGKLTAHTIKRVYFNHIANEWAYETIEGKSLLECYLFAKPELIEKQAIKPSKYLN